LASAALPTGKAERSAGVFISPMLLMAASITARALRPLNTSFELLVRGVAPWQADVVQLLAYSAAPLTGSSAYAPNDATAPSSAVPSKRFGVGECMVFVEVGIEIRRRHRTRGARSR